MAPRSNDSPIGRRASTPSPSPASSRGRLVVVAPNLIKLSLDVEVLNACVLPIVLGFLLALERRALPVAFRMRGARRTITYAL